MEAQTRRSELAPLLNGKVGKNTSHTALTSLPKNSKPSRFGSIFSIKLLLAAVIATIAFYTSFGQFGKNQISDLHPLDFAARTERLLSKYGVYDGHNDLVYLIRIELKNQIQNNDKFPLGKGLLSHT